MHSRAATLLLIFTLAAKTMAQDLAPVPSGTPARDAYTVTCTLERGRIIAPLTVNAQEGLRALVDAGLQAPVLSTQTAASLHIETSAAHRATLERFAFTDKLEFRGDAAVADLATFTERLGAPLDAIAPLHQPGLEVTLDLAHAQILYRPLDDAKLSARAGGVEPLTLRDGVTPLVPVLIAGKYVREMLLDLSFGGVASFSEATLDALGLLGTNPDAIRTVNGEGGDAVQFRLPTSLRIGETDLEQPVCDMAPGPDRLGLGALAHFRLTLNYEAGLLRWESNAGPQIAAQPLIAYGLTLHRLRAGQWELAVTNDSPASEAGILPGATLAGIGNTPLRQTNHAATGRLLRADVGSTIDVTIVQQGTPLSLTLVARRLL